MPDEASFDEFYLATRGSVLSQLTAMTLDRELAADSVQEAYTRAWQRWSRVSQLSSPTAWVRTVAWRLAVSQFRRRAVASGRLRQLQPDPGVAEEDQTVGLDVLAALRALSEERRRVLVLHEMVGMSIREIAAETEVAEGTVKSRLYRAREQLSVALGPGYLDGSVRAAPDVPVRE